MRQTWVPLRVRLGEDEVEVSPRVWKIIRWLVMEQERLRRDKVQVTFDCAGDQVSVAVKERVQVG